MGFLWITKAAGSNSLANTGQFNFRSQDTTVNHEPVPLEIRQMHDGAVIEWTKVFGFTKEILSRYHTAPEELKNVVSYVYSAMRKQDDQETGRQIQILKEIQIANEQEYFFRDLITYIRVSFSHNYSNRKLKSDIDDGNPVKQRERRLRDGLGKEGLPVNRNTTIEDVFRIVLEKIRSSPIKYIN